MTRQGDAVRLWHMLDHAREAVELVAHKQRTDLQSERLLELALVRLVEIIGEAAARISEETCARHTSIPWPQIVGMRNRLIHGYESIDLNVLWDTITDDLPPLITAPEEILTNEPPDTPSLQADRRWKQQGGLRQADRRWKQQGAYSPRSPCRA